MLSLIYIALSFAVFMYLVAPIIIKFSQQMAAHPTIQPVMAEGLPGEVAGYLLNTAHYLQADGFEIAGHAYIPGSMANVVPVVTLLQNRTTGDTASVAVFYVQSPTGTRLGTRYVEFCTDTADGRELSTLNTKMPSSFKTPPTKISIRVPFMEDPRQMYRLHRYASCKYEMRSDMARLQRDVFTRLSEGMQREVANQIDTGYLYYDRAVDKYRPTWYGAFMMTWGLLFPIKPIKQAIKTREARALIAEMDRTAWQ